MRKFYMVWRVGGGAPNAQHASLEQAVAEATRLVEREKAGAYVVLEAQKVVKRQEAPVVVEDCYASGGDIDALG